MAMVDSYHPPQEYGQPVQLPHRKPLPQSAVQNVARNPYLSQDPRQQASHSHTRTSSSNVFPNNPMTTTTTTYSVSNTGHARRTLSNATTSTTVSSTGSNHHNPALGRSPSGRSSIMSTNGPLSYVALMRKQKATVWCERAQHEDPRLLAAQRAARKRAQIEFAGGPHNTAQARTSTASSGTNGGVRSKIRHHGVPKATPYQPANLAGSGVPMRLSATEVDDEVGSDDDGAWSNGPAGYNNHKRSGSGRSSLNSMGARASYIGAPRIHSTGSTPPSLTGNNSPAMRSEDNFEKEEETPVPRYRQSNEYFPKSASSNGSRENSFGDVKQLPRVERPPIERNKTDELRRRGSVDDRTTTMSGNVRLFVANPDLD